MSDYNSIEKKKEFIFAKYLLGKLSADKLKKRCVDSERYYELLYQLESIMVLEQDYILLRNHADKYKEIINYGRFHFDTKNDIRSYENMTLITLNTLELTKDEYKKEYIGNQLKIRCGGSNKLVFYYMENYPMFILEEFVNGFAIWDYHYLTVMDALIKCKRVKLNLTDGRILHHMSSISYLTSQIPEIFRQDCQYIDATLRIIDTYESNNLIPHDYNVKKIKRKLNCLRK